MMDKGAQIRLGVDIGGTFTDLVLIDEARGAVHIAKVLTTPDDPAEGALTGFQNILESAGLEASGLASIVHATTLITNALIERKGARTGLITTKGFSDVIEIGREKRFDLYDLHQEMPEPLVPEELRAEAPERVHVDGEVVAPLDAEAVKREAERLLRLGAESIAVSFLHAPVNPGNERAARAAIEQVAGDMPVSISSEVAPETGEYERTSTTAANAYVRPIADAYLTRLLASLRDSGFAGDLFIMLSNSGFATIDSVREHPVRIIESGPAGGALAAAQIARSLGEAHALGFDMGGTTAKICLIEEGEPATENRFEVARTSRFQKGSGLPILSPTVDLVEIGAGGGSIAGISDLGLIRVGPQSAGATPGPACYDQGGEQPTVTDANLLLGYLNPEFFLGGAMRLDSGKAREAVSSLAGKLDMRVEDAAWGIYEIITEQMASAARVHIAEKGGDPRNYALIATGGAAPLHACHMAKKLYIRRIVCPPDVGVASAAGLLAARPRADAVRVLVSDVDAVDWTRVEALYWEMAAQMKDSLGDGIGVDGRWEFLCAADMRYRGQTDTVSVPLPEEGGMPVRDAANMQESFERAYERRYLRKIESVAAEAAAWRLTMLGPGPQGMDVAPLTDEAEFDKGTRKIYAGPERGFSEARVYHRYSLPAGREFSGPAIVEERESTIVVPGDARFRKDAGGHIVIEVAG